MSCVRSFWRRLVLLRLSFLPQVFLSIPRLMLPTCWWRGALSCAGAREAVVNLRGCTSCCLAFFSLGRVCRGPLSVGISGDPNKRTACTDLSSSFGQVWRRPPSMGVLGDLCGCTACTGLNIRRVCLLRQ